MRGQILLQFSLFYLAFIEHEPAITPGQHIFDMSNEGCPHAADSGEISYPVVYGALQRGGFALFLGTVHDDLISTPEELFISVKIEVVLLPRIYFLKKKKTTE